MGLFDFVGDIFGGVGDLFGGAIGGLTGILDPISSIAGLLSPIANVAAPAISYINAQQGTETSAAAIEAQIQGQKDTNAINVAEAQKNREFQERLSSTAHQREIIDLTKAGLNPILSATRGGSSTPTGSMATAQNPYAGHADNVNSAQRLNSIERSQLLLNTVNAVADIQKKHSETALNEQNTIKSQMEGLLADTASSLNQQKVFTEIAQQHNLTAQTGEKSANTDLLTQKAYSEIINQMLLKVSAQEKQSQIDLNSARAAESTAQSKLHGLSFIEREKAAPIKAYTNSADAVLNSSQNLFDLVNPLKSRRQP
ncbi:MAG: DNA pilot protein [Microviridae sp.]|nr:MAG: DNA pilot protein [Microviridae sp.]